VSAVLPTQGSGEFGLIARHFTRTGRPGRALLGVGDDCALLEPARGALAVSTDMLLEGRHFFADVAPESLGHKALAVNLSDLAAMGASPVAFTLALALPELDDAWLAAFARGLFALADEHRCELVGGDTTRGPLNVCITVMGEVDPAQALRRDGARAGDDLWVSGCLGGAAWAVAHRQDSGGWIRPATVASADFDSALQALHRPQPRLVLGLALRGLASAAIDLSDGLAGDLHHVLTRSSEAAGESLAARIDLPRLPLHDVLAGLPHKAQYQLALAGGDDYELLFSAAPQHRSTLTTLGERLGVPLVRIGAIDGAPIADETPRLRLIDAQGQTVGLALQAHDHFLTRIAE
jgi:thiamine-monophosphate kinase